MPPLTPPKRKGLTLIPSPKEREDCKILAKIKDDRKRNVVATKNSNYSLYAYSLYNVLLYALANGGKAVVMQ